MILAGGLSTRIGRDKGGLKIGGHSLADTAVAVMGAVFEDLVYVTNSPKTAPRRPNLTIAQDEIPHLGPLGGLLAGLKAIKTSRAFVVAYDMPFVNPNLIELMLAKNSHADVVVGRVGGQLEPLHAVYGRQCVLVIEAQLEKGERKIKDFYTLVKVEVVEEAELRKIDPELKSFFNINTWQDYESAGGV